MLVLVNHTIGSNSISLDYTTHLGARWANTTRWSFNFEAIFAVFFAFESRVIVGLLAEVPISAGYTDSRKYGFDNIFLFAHSLAYNIPQVGLDKALQLAIRCLVDCFFKKIFKATHECLQAFYHRYDLDDCKLLL